VDPRNDPTPPYAGPARALASNEDDLAELIIACKQGRLYDVERWIASGHPLQLDPGVEVRIRRKPTAMSLSISSGALDLTRLLLCNGYRQELESSPPLDAALERRRWDLLELLLDWGAEWQPAMSIADYEYALREIAELARSRGAEVWFLTAPQAFHDAEGIARYEARTRFVLTRLFFDQFNEDFVELVAHFGG
jgi:hypothetical protein